MPKRVNKVVTDAYYAAAKVSHKSSYSTGLKGLFDNYFMVLSYDSSNISELVSLGPMLLKPFTTVIYERFNKLECLSLASFSSIVQCLWVRPRAYPTV